MQSPRSLLLTSQGPRCIVRALSCALVYVNPAWKTQSKIGVEVPIVSIRSNDVATWSCKIWFVTEKKRTGPGVSRGPCLDKGSRSCLSVEAVCSVCGFPHQSRSLLQGCSCHGGCLVWQISTKLQGSLLGQTYAPNHSFHHCGLKKGNPHR